MLKVKNCRRAFEITQLHDVENARLEGVELLQGSLFERR
jgi:hypothetical protein